MYSAATGRYSGLVESHRNSRLAGSFMLEHSANVLTRLYRNAPDDSLSAYLP